jgi:hypothetical protein
MDVSVILRLIDGISGPAKQAAQSLRSLVTAANALKKLNLGSNLTSGLKSSQAQVRAMLGDTKQLSSAFRGATDGARGLASAMSAGSKGAYATDVRNLKQMVSLQSQMVKGQQRMAGVGGGGFGHHGMGYGGGLYMAAYGAHRVGRGIASGFAKGGNLQNELTLLENFGLPTDKINEITKAARAASSAVPQISVSDSLHSFREMRYAFADTNHAIESMTMMNKFAVTMGAVVGADRAGEIKDQVYAAAKSAEMTNQIKSKTELQAWLDSMQQAAESSGGIVDPQKMFQGLKYARDAALGYDDEFKRLFLPEYVQELSSGGRKGGGSRGGAGSGLNAFKRMFGDQTFAAKHIDDWIKLGLIDPRKVVSDLHGANKKKLLPGAVIGQQEAIKNPFRYIQDYIKPALRRLGIDPSNPADAAKAVQALGTLGGTQLAKQILQLTALMDAQMEKRAQMTAMAAKVDASYGRLIENYNQSLKGMHEQFSTMTSWVTLPFLPEITALQNSITKFTIGFREFFATHNKAITALAPGLMLGGGGLMAMLLRSVIGRGLIGVGIGGLLGGPMGAMMGGMLGRGFGAAGTAAGTTFAGSFIASVLRGIGKGLGVYAILEAIQGIKQDDKDPDHKLRSTVRKALGIPDSASDPSRSQEWLPSWMEGIRNGGLRRDPVPFANLLPKTDMDAGALGKTFTGQPGAFNGVWPEADKSKADSEGKSWGQTFLDAVTGVVTGVAPFAPESDQAKADSEGKSWGQSFLDAVKAIVSGAAIAGPNVAAPSISPGSIGVPMHYAPAAPAGGGGAQRASLGSVVVHVGGIVVHGNGDPRAVADEVHRKFTSAVSRHLSDGAFA